MLRLIAPRVLGSLLVLGVFAPPVARAAGDVIRLGVAGPQSGELASYGIPSSRAAALVVKQINAAGGVLGRQVELLVEDDVCKPEIAANTAGKLVSAKADAVLGHICSGAAKAALGIYRDAGIIALSPSATNPDLTQSGQYPNFYRTIAPDDAQARIEVDFALETLKVGKIAVLHDKQDYGRGLAEFAKKYIEASGGRGRVVLFEGITPGAVDYSAVISKVRQSGAEAVIYGGYHPEASKLVSGMRRKQIDLPFISDDGVKDDTFIKVAGAFAEGVYASGPRDTSTNPMAIAAVAAHREAYGGDPGAFYLNAWAGTQALLNAIARAGGTDQAAVARALHTEWVETPLGKIRFDARGDAEGVGFAMYRVTDGVYVELR